MSMKPGPELNVLLAADGAVDDRVAVVVAGDKVEAVDAPGNYQVGQSHSL